MKFLLLLFYVSFTEGCYNLQCSKCIVSSSGCTYIIQNDFDGLCVPKHSLGNYFVKSRAKTEADCVKYDGIKKLEIRAGDNIFTQNDSKCEDFKKTIEDYNAELSSVKLENTKVIGEIQTCVQKLNSGQFSSNAVMENLEGSLKNLTVELSSAKRDCALQLNAIQLTCSKAVEDLNTRENHCFRLVMSLEAEAMQLKSKAQKNANLSVGPRNPATRAKLSIANRIQKQMCKLAKIFRINEGFNLSKNADKWLKRNPAFKNTSFCTN